MERNKFLILLFSTIIAAFFGSFLASCLILTPAPIFVKTIPMSDIDRQFINQQPIPVDYPIFGNTLLNAGNVTSIKTEETKDGYKIKINLKPFNNDPKNVDVKIKGKKVSISAQYKSKTKQGTSSSQFFQTLTLPEKIDIKAVKQEKQGDSLVITIPKSEPKK